MKPYWIYITNKEAQRVLWIGEDHQSTDTALEGLRKEIRKDFPKAKLDTTAINVPIGSLWDHKMITHTCQNSVDWYHGELNDVIDVVQVHYDFMKHIKTYQLCWRGNLIDPLVDLPEHANVNWVGQGYDENYEETNEWVLYLSGTKDKPLSIEGCPYYSDNYDDVIMVTYDKGTLEKTEVVYLFSPREKMIWKGDHQEMYFHGWATKKIKGIEKTPLLKANLDNADERAKIDPNKGYVRVLGKDGTVTREPL